MALATNKVKVRLTFMEEVLGTQPGDPEIYKNFIATKNPVQTEKMTKEEIENLPEIDEEEFARGITFFPRKKDDKGVEHVAMYGYMLKGFFKNACSAVKNQPGTLSANLSAYKKKIDNLVFVNRISCIDLSEDIFKDGKLPLLQRPLRVQTMKGERVALACSEQIPEGSTVDFEIETLNREMMNLVFEWLDYGKFNGLGCWHNSGKGRFTWEQLDCELKDDAVAAPKKRGRKKKEESEEE